MIFILDLFFFPQVHTDKHSDGVWRKVQFEGFHKHTLAQGFATSPVHDGEEWWKETGDEDARWIPNQDRSEAPKADIEEAEESKQSPVIKRIDVSPAISPSPCLDFLKWVFLLLIFRMNPSKCVLVH